jgi:hypothetical protein
VKFHASDDTGPSHGRVDRTTLRDDPTPFNEMVATFREVRKARQSPAHKAEDSTFDQNLFKEQRELRHEPTTLCARFG